MKRFVAILMAAAMLLTVLAGCSGSTKPADTTPAADSSTAADETESAAPSASAITVVLSDVGNNMDPSVANAINTFRRSVYTLTQSIVTTDSQTIAAKLNGEYIRAKNNNQRLSILGSRSAYHGTKLHYHI